MKIIGAISNPQWSAFSSRFNNLSYKHLLFMPRTGWLQKSTLCFLPAKDGIIKTCMKLADAFVLL